MAEKHEMGKQGEAIAAAYLESLGCHILERNWQSNHQEIDIIAREEQLLLIVEVKSRSSSYHGAPETSVTRNKQRMLIKAANHYVLKNKLHVEVRFDIITVIPGKEQHTINHIKNAFYPY